MKRLIVRSAAESDVRDAINWLVRERGTSAAVEFLDAVEETVERIRKYPRMYAIVEEPIRRAMVPRFPYGVYYVDGSECVSVLAVMHFSRHPSTWIDRG